MVKRIDFASAPVRIGAAYPEPYATPCRERLRRQLGNAAGLAAFGVNHLTLPPGAWSSQRHWHSAEDEFVMVLSGEVVLITDAGEETLRAGDCAGFKAGDADGHHLVNRSHAEATVLEVGAREEATDRVTYSDIDMVAEPGEPGYRRRDGSPISA